MIPPDTLMLREAAAPVDSAASSEVDEAPDSERTMSASCPWLRDREDLPSALEAVDDALLSELSDEPLCEAELEEDIKLPEVVVVPALPPRGVEAPVADDWAVATPVGVPPLT
jgi:hypothetical protein